MGGQKIIRHARLDDLSALFELFALTDVGMTSLPKDKALLKQRLSNNEKALDGTLPKAQRRYLFVLEDVATGALCGVSGIDAFIGQTEPFYDFALGQEKHHSTTLGVTTSFELMTLNCDYTGSSELCSLFLAPDYRGGYNGKLLSKSRLLFMATNPDEFAEQVIAEMRGYFDEAGVSPYWQHFSRQLFGGHDFAHIDYVLGSGERGIITEMAPRFPVYLDFMDDKARRYIGKVHPSTEGALALLKSEGFVFAGHIDMVDGGPKMVAKVCDLRSTTDTKQVPANITQTPKSGNTPYLVSNGKFADFRASVLLLDDKDSLSLSPALADSLQVKDGEYLSVLPLDGKI